MEEVAILLATYNGGPFIEEQLESLKMQNYKNFKCYIHDDGSTDNTITIIRKYCTNDSSKFHLIETPSTGAAKNNFMYLLREFGIKHPYVMFCDQDDIWLPDKVQKSIDAVKKIEIDKETPCLAYCDMKVVDGSLNIISQSFINYNQLIIDEITFDRAIMKCYAAGCSMIINNALASCSAITDSSLIVMHDWWVMMIASAIGYIKRIPSALILYRQHGNNSLGAKHITKASRVKEISKRILTFEQFSVTRRGLYTRVNQLSRCKDVSVLYKKYLDMIDSATKFNNLSKFKRCRFILENKLYQNKWSKIWTCICS